MFHSEYESRLRSPSKSPSKNHHTQQYKDLPPIPSPFLNFTQDSNNNNNNNNNIPINNNTNNSNNSNISNNNDDFKIIRASPSKLKVASSLILPQSNGINSKSEIYGDRFIPIAIGIENYSSSLENYNSSYPTSPMKYNGTNSDGSLNSVDRQRDESHLAYNLILKNEILGPNSNFIDNQFIYQQSVSNINHLPSATNNDHFNHTNINNNVNNGNSELSNKSPIHSPIKNGGYSLMNSGNILQFSSPTHSSKSKRDSHYLSHNNSNIHNNSNANNLQSFNSPIPSSSSTTLDSPYSLSLLSGDSQRLLSSPRKPQRKISKTPFKILDAPNIKDDFYLNLVDWSSLNILAVGLEHSVYLWNASTSQVSKLCDFDPSQPISSVSWIQRGSHLAIGGHDGIVQIWDVTKKKKIRELKGQNQRVNALAWNSHILSSGGKDKVILHHDVRDSQSFSQRLIGHKHEICGLKWSPDGQQLASGGNDNLLNVWDHRLDNINNISSSNSSSNNNNISRPIYQFKFHNAAVKAIAWSPHQRGLLASGGGTHDKCIRFTNTITGSPIQCIDTSSQVCNLAWSKNVNELVSTHGFSQNQITVWSYPTMTPISTLTGHTTRVLYLSVSPDGQTIVTGAGDQTLRFWNIFPNNKDSNNCNLDSFYNSKYDMDIR